MRARMVPVATIADQLHRAVRDVARSLGKHVRFDVTGGETELDRSVLVQLSDTLLHLVRNAVDHGIETDERREAAGKPPEATVRLHAMQLGAEVIIAVSDDGRGIDVESVRRMAARQGVDTDGMNDEETLQLIFRSGLSTASFVSDISGRGVGLDVVRASVAAASGRVEVRSEPGRGTEFRVIVPVSLAVAPCLVVSVDDQRFALPLRQVVSVLEHEPDSESHVEGRPVIMIERRPVPLSSLAEVLGVGASTTASGPVVVVSGATHRHAFRVDTLVGRQDVVVKDLGKLLPGLDLLSGASVGVDGSIMLLLDPSGIIDRARRVGGRDSVDRARGAVDDELDQADAALSHARILVVDDALTVRELQRSILERAGYDVRVAGDGREALARLAEEPSDLVLTDVDMPEMDGFTLTSAIRANPTLANVPILILTSRATDADRQRGLEAGANGYIVKSAFDEAALLGAVERLLGSRV
jgi:two-component system chemotaxis sensor kinase CheA